MQRARLVERTAGRAGGTMAALALAPVLAMGVGCSSGSSSSDPSAGPPDGSAAITEGGKPSGGSTAGAVAADGGTVTKESASCTRLTSATGSIVDAAGNVWSLAAGGDSGGLSVLANGAAAGFTVEVVALLYIDHVVSQENVAGDWWSWTANAWVSVADPTAGCATADGGAGGSSGAGDGGVFTAPSGEQAKMADAFVDSIGANTHFAFGDTNWGADRDSLIIPGLAKMGIRHVRDSLDLADSSVYPVYADVYDTVKQMTGTVVSFDLVLPYPSQYSSCNTGSVDVGSLVGHIPAVNVDSFEGINEWNIFSSNAGLSCGHGWQDDLRTSQPALFASARGNATFASTKILGPALAFLSFDQLASDATSAGDLSASMDYGADHSYPGGLSPSTNLQGYRRSVVALDKTRPFTVTESGYYTQPDGAQGISELAEGKYMSRFYLEYFNAGSLRTYVYDLVDDTSESGSEANFGLMRGDGTFKPGATAVENEIALLADLGPDFAPGKLDYTLGSAPSQVHHTLLQKRNGTMYLVLWQEVDVYDVQQKKDLAVASVAVDVDLGQAFPTVNQYDVVSGTTPTMTATNVQKLTVAVGDQAIVLEVKP